MAQRIKVDDNATAMFKYPCVANAARKADGHLAYLILVKKGNHRCYKQAQKGDTICIYDNGEVELFEKR